MVSFQCDGCGDVVKKPKLNQHGNRCYATFTCIDCSTTFQGTSYQSHNSCMTEAEKFQKHIYQAKNGPSTVPVKKKSVPKQTAPSTSKPMSIIDQLNEKKRKNDSKEEEKEKPKSKKTKSGNLSSWSADELDKDESRNLKNALKHILEENKSLSLKDVRKKTIELIEKHPKFKRSGKSDLKKSFDKQFSLTLKDDSITFA
ncbi:hypothetical protein [Parasitella parasitica]|uniref:Zinc finger C2H2 LYAR-type domain-containing protein n=1 Tax=Parasitella parasitica TaxID=35722 RepID=A0A0B7N7N8_9FUNG|nr:hypothetical protein [Parasitella parasitica]